MSLKNMKKEELELLSYNDIANLLLEEEGKKNTALLWEKIVKLLELPQSAFESKIGDFYTSLTTDKRFILLDDGSWDLRSNHKASNIIIEDDEDVEEPEDVYDDYEEEKEEDLYSDDSEEPEEVEEYKNLVVIDEEDLNNIE